MNPILQQKLEAHQLWLADPLTGAQCIHIGDDLTGVDFTAYNICKAKLNRNNLTNCIMSENCQQSMFRGCFGTNADFSKSDITGASFENSDISGFNYIGASWGGKILTKNPIQWTNGYWVMQTDTYAQIGCQQFTIDQWFAFNDGDRLTFDKIDPQKAVDWWKVKNQTLQNYVTQYMS